MCEGVVVKYPECADGSINFVILDKICHHVLDDPDGFPYTDHTLLVFNLLGNFFERGLGVSVVFSGPFPPFGLVLVRGFLVSVRYFRFLDQFNPFYILCSKAVCETGERFRLLPGLFQQA